MRHGSLRFTLPIVLLAFITTRTGAQVMRGADLLTRSEVADSQRVLVQLDERVRAMPGDASAWYRRGMVAWALAERASAGNAPGGLDANRLRRLADTSLRIAARLAPENTGYRLTTGRFLLASGVGVTRAAAAGFFEQALELARKNGTPREHAETAIEYGRVFWRRYEAVVNRRMLTNVGDIGRSLSDAMNPIAKGAWILEELAERERADEAIRSLLQRAGGGAGLAGGSAWQSAAQSFQTTVATAGNALTLHSGADPNASKLTAGAAAAHMQTIATGSALATTLMDGADPHGLALTSVALKAIRELIEAHSQPLPLSVTGANQFARADTLFTEAYRADATAPWAFRSVAMLLAEKNLWLGLELFAREHLKRYANDGHARMALGLALQRRGLTNDAMAAFDTALAKLDYDERMRLDDVGRVVGPARARRLNRDDPDVFAVFQKMYWMTSDRMWTYGGNEPRAEILARVTFAELRWTVDELGLQGADTDRGDVYVRYGPPNLVAAIGPKITESAADIMTFWMYDSGLTFAFSGLSGFGTARIPHADRAMITELTERQPVRFDNLGALRPDSLLAQTARFRAHRDSIDMFVAVAPPVRTIRESMPVVGPARADFWLVAPTAVVAHRDSILLDAPGVRTWTARVRPGAYLFRVEASGVGASRVARSSALVQLNEKFALTGPGISDVLLAASAEARAQPAASWRDLTIVPLVGVVAQGEPLALVWENYELASRAGAAEYSVAVTIVRQRSAAGAIVAAVTGALASIARVETKPDRVVIGFDRTTPHANVIADVVNLNLANTPTGTYTLTLDVRDRISGAVYTRSTTVTIAK